MKRKFKELTMSEFKREVENEASSTDYARYPARFIIVENLHLWKEVLDFLKSFTDVVVKLSSFCKGVDTYPDVNSAISKAIEEAKQGKRILLIPFSELMRFGEDYTPIIHKIASFEIAPMKNGRIYIPLYGVESYFFKIWNTYPDIGIRKYPAIVVLEECERILGDHSIEVWITKDTSFLEISQTCKSINIVPDLKRYFEIWESGEIPRKLLMYSEVLFERTPHATGKVCVSCVKDYKELAEKILNLNIPVQYHEDEKEFWKNLLEQLLKGKYTNFYDFVRSKFNVMRFQSDLFYRWQDMDEFDRWLLFHWGKLELNDNSYLHYVLQNSPNFQAFEDRLWSAVFDMDDITIKIIKERVEILRRTNIPQPPNLISRVRKISDPIRRLKVLTGITFEEKKEILTNLASCFKESIDFEKLLKIIEITYPELYYYLRYPILDDEFLDNYMRVYIRAKLMNEYINDLKTLSEKLKNLNIYKYKSRNEALEKYKCKQIWVDGLGVEWIGLIYNWLRSRNYTVNFEIVRANLPSTSEFNQIPCDAIKEVDLDAIFHRQDRDYPENIVDELERVSAILKEKVEPLIGMYGEVIITADHGATRFSAWIDRRIDIESVEKVERNGRYVVTSSRPPDNDEYYVEMYDGKYYVISKTHAVFKGGRRTKGENHGGATPEEVLVPIMHVKRSDQVVVQRYVELSEKVILAINPVFEVRINPPVDKVYILISNHLIRGERIDEDTWKFDLRQLELKPGSYNIEIHFDGESKSEKIEIKGGLEEEELFEG